MPEINFNLIGRKSKYGGTLIEKETEILNNNYIARITKDGEVINEAKICIARTKIKDYNTLTAEQKKRTYARIFFDTIYSFYKLTNSEKNTLVYINECIVGHRFNPSTKGVIAIDTNKRFYENCSKSTGDSIDTIKKAITSLRDKGFLFNYISEIDNKPIKGSYVVNPKYIYTASDDDYINEVFELSKKGILVLIE